MANANGRRDPSAAATACPLPHSGLGSRGTGHHIPFAGDRPPLSERQLRWLLHRGIVAVIRSPDGARLGAVARGVADGGGTVVEITMSVPTALGVLRRVRHALGDRVLLGAGTVLDPGTARAVVLAGAEFVVAP